MYLRSVSDTFSLPVLRGPGCGAEIRGEEFGSSIMPHPTSGPTRWAFIQRTTCSHTQPGPASTPSPRDVCERLESAIAAYALRVPLTRALEGCEVKEENETRDESLTGFHQLPFTIHTPLIHTHKHSARQVRQHNARAVRSGLTREKRRCQSRYSIDTLYSLWWRRLPRHWRR